MPFHSALFNMKTRVSLKYFMIVFGNNFLILIRYQTPSKLILVTAFGDVKVLYYKSFKVVRKFFRKFFRRVF